MHKQALPIAQDIINDLYNGTPEALRKDLDKDALVNDLKTKEIIALIAYLQRLGTDIKKMAPVENEQTTVEETQAAENDTVAQPAEVQTK